MSKCEIVAHLGNGKYRVRQAFAVDAIKKEVSDLSERIAELAVELPTKKLELLQSQQKIKDKVQDIDLLIPDIMAGVDGAREKIAALQKDLIALQATNRQLEMSVASLIAENLAALKRRNQLKAVPEHKEVDAWCADYTENLTGDAGLADINDEGGTRPIIQPGFSGEAAYNKIRDGSLFPNLAQSGPQIYLNAALLPGVQKWMPRYRVGRLLNLSGDSCTIALDGAASSAQNLPINKASKLHNVPIVYMDCNGSAFSNGDRVLIKFTTSGPLVIGFESDPVPCTVNDFICVPSLFQSSGEDIGYGKPFLNAQGVEINPPLGTLGGQSSAWSLTPAGGTWTKTRGLIEAYGSRNWVGTTKEDVLSFQGPKSRACAMYLWAPSEATKKTLGGAVYWKGSIILSLGFGVRETLEGAAIAYKNGKRYLRVCMSNANAMHANRDMTKLTLGVFDYYWAEGGMPQNPIQQAVFTSEYDYPPSSGAYFSANGNKMVITCAKEKVGDCFVYRWSGGSISETRDQSQETGEIVTSFDRSVGGSQDEHLYTSFSKNGRAPDYEATIYYDFKGDVETRVYAIYSARTHAESRSGSDESFGNLANSLTSKSYAESRVMSSGPLIVKSGGTEIYRSPQIEQYSDKGSGSWQDRSKDTDNGPIYSSSGSTSQHITNNWTSVDLTTMFLDGRFDLAFASETERRSSTESGMERSTATGRWTRTSHVSMLFRTSICLWVSGNEVARDSVVTQDSSTTKTTPNAQYPIANFDDEPYTKTDPYSHRTSKAYPSIRTPRKTTLVPLGSFAKTAGKTMAAFAYTVSSREAIYLRINYVTGISDPVSHFLGRTEESGHTFSNISLI